MGTDKYLLNQNLPITIKTLWDPTLVSSTTLTNQGRRGFPFATGWASAFRSHGRQTPTCFRRVAGGLSAPGQNTAWGVQVSESGQPWASQLPQVAGPEHSPSPSVRWHTASSEKFCPVRAERGLGEGRQKEHWGSGAGLSKGSLFLSILASSATGFPQSQGTGPPGSGPFLKQTPNSNAALLYRKHIKVFIFLDPPSLHQYN